MSNVMCLHVSFFHVGVDAWDLHYYAKGNVDRLGCQQFMLVNVKVMLFFI
jgi:hypothetical protein